MSDTEPAAILERLNGPRELQVAVLALLLPPGSKRAARAWQRECADYAPAAAIGESAGRLAGAARLPWLELLLTRLRAQPLSERQNLLEATRRVMSARGVQRPLDRLHWLAMRQRLGESSPAANRVAATTELSQLPQHDVEAIAVYSAFLARMVPKQPAELDDPAPTPAGLAWYASVMAPWAGRAEIPPCEPPATDGFVNALQVIQAVAWMQRPALVRGWTGAAILHSPYGRLDDTAADALRLSCSLLDSPLPPELARHYGTNAFAAAS
ncbi:MAG TPA: hypothetical protein VGM74_00510 [Burkholderiaceae bacterium]|jgi:hypothetical protein